jgi:hypothetical protein
MFKQVKEWIRCGLNVSHFKSVRRERLLSVDEEHKPYIRGKRSTNYLPNSWDTQWIRRPKKSWKERSKNKHQYDKVYHTLSEKVNNYELKDQFDEEEFLFLLKNRYKDNWYYFHSETDIKKMNLNTLYNIIWRHTWYQVAERLVEKGKLEAITYDHLWEFNDFGIIEKRSKTFILAVKLK